MTTFTLDFPGLASSPATLTITQVVRTTPAATPAGQPTQYLIRAVDQFGTILKIYPTARAKEIVWIRNEPGSATIDIPLDVDIADLDIPNEVQVWRNGHLLWWGRVVTRIVNARTRTWSLSCDGLLSYFKRRYMDKGGVGLTDFLDDVGNFEGTDLDDYWTIAYGLFGGSGATKSADTTIKILDDQSAQLDGDSVGGDRYLYRQLIIDSTSIGVALFLTGYVFVQTMNVAPHQNRGMLLGYFDTPGDPFLVTTPGALGIARLDTNTPTGSWVRLDCVAHLPPGPSRLVEVRLYIPDGTVYWDAVRLRVMESFSMIAANAPDGIGWDQVDIVHSIFDFLQGRGGFPSGNKSDLNIDTVGAPSGVIKHRTYQFFDHQPGYKGANGSGAVDEFLRASDGIDIEMRYSPTVRWVETFYPALGTSRSTWRFRWHRVPTDDVLPDDRWGIVDWTYEESVVDTANEITELSGWGTGAGREEGGYSNPASLGGLTLELVEGAPQDSPIDALDPIAEGRGAQLENPIALPTFVIAEPRDPVTQEVLIAMVGVLMPGDTIPVDFADGALAFDDDYRTARVRLDCDTDLLHVTVNPTPVGGG